MWLYLIAGALILFGIVVGLAGGGIFTIVLLPLGLVVLVSAIVFGGAGRRAQRSGGGATDESHVSERPLPHSQPRPSGREPTSPEALADARRAQQ